jgi:hypothetical protein
VSLTDVTLSDNLEYIAIETFYGCSGLRQLDVPASVRSIGSGTFHGCRSLEAIVLRGELEDGDLSVLRGGGASATVYTSKDGERRELRVF